MGEDEQLNRLAIGFVILIFAAAAAWIVDQLVNGD